jgi:hypothetical protein
MSSSIIRRGFVGFGGTPVPFATIGGPPTSTADQISDPSETPVSSTSENTSSSVTVSVGCGEAASATLLSCWGTPVPFTTVGDPSTTTVDGISSPSEILISSASGTTEGTSPSVTVSVWCGEAASAALLPALFEGVSLSSNSSVKYDEASLVAQGSERAERKCPSLNASAGYDEAPSVVPCSEIGDRPNLRAKSSCRWRPSCARLRSAGGVDADRRVRALSGTV